MDIYKKTITIKIYNVDNKFIGVWKDFTFDGFSKQLNGGLGQCVIKLAKGFNYQGSELKLNNQVRIYVTDRDTINADNGNKEKLIYTGYISKYESILTSDKEEILVYLLGYHTKFTQDIYKNGTDISINQPEPLTDPAVDIGTMMANIIERYIAETVNSPINYNLAGLKTTSTTGKYFFELMTYLEAINAVKEMAPNDWYWYVGEDLLFEFTNKPTTATHDFILGKHFSSVTVERSMEKIKNAMMIKSNSVDAGNLLKLYSDTGSIDDYGRRIEKKYDEQLYDEVTANKIGEEFVNNHKDIDIRVNCVIFDNNYHDSFGYDIESINPGDTCTFRGFNDSYIDIFKENMLITSVKYDLEKVFLTIEPMKAGIVTRQEKSIRGIDEIRRQDSNAVYTV